MSIVTLRNVEFVNNPAKFLDSYKFKVTFECLAPLNDDLEWRLIYVSSPNNNDLDQALDDCAVGPIPSGVSAFSFEGCAPDPSMIPHEDVLGVAALILTGAYNDQEFVRVGYYQNTEYDTEELRADPPNEIQFERLVRNISEKPRVTRFQIKWDVTPTQNSFQAIGASSSAAVPSANDFNDDDDDEETQKPVPKSNAMQVDS